MITWKLHHSYFWVKQARVRDGVRLSCGLLIHSKLWSLNRFARVSVGIIWFYRGGMLSYEVLVSLLDLDWPAGRPTVAGLLSHWGKVHLISSASLGILMFQVLEWWQTPLRSIGITINNRAHRNISIAVCFIRRKKSVTSTHFHQPMSSLKTNLRSGSYASTSPEQKLRRSRRKTNLKFDSYSKPQTIERILPKFVYEKQTEQYWGQISLA